MHITHTQVPLRPKIKMPIHINELENKKKLLLRRQSNYYIKKTLPTEKVNNKFVQPSTNRSNKMSLATNRRSLSDLKLHDQIWKDGYLSTGNHSTINEKDNQKERKNRKNGKVLSVRKQEILFRRQIPQNYVIYQQKQKFVKKNNISVNKAIMFNRIKSKYNKHLFQQQQPDTNYSNTLFINKPVSYQISKLTPKEILNNLKKCQTNFKSIKAQKIITIIDDFLLPSNKDKSIICKTEKKN